MITDYKNSAFADGACHIKKISITIDDYLYAFYMKVGENAGGIKPEQVMANALFKLAGGLSLNAINEKSAKKVETDCVDKDGLR